MKRSISIIFGCAIVSVAFIPQIFFRTAFSNGDAVLSFYPTYSFFQRQLISGDSFLWTRGILGGFPLFVDLSGGFFSPLNRILFSVLEVVDAYNAAILIATLALFWSTFLFLRTIELSRSASLFGAVIYTFGYHVQNWSNNIVVMNAMFVLPLTLAMIKNLHDKKYILLPVWAFSLWYALMNGQPQWILIAMVGSLFYTVYLFWDSIKIRDYRSLAVVGLSGLLAAGSALWLALPHLNTSVIYSELSTRSAGLSLQDAQISSQTPFDWLWYILPELSFRWISASEPTLYLGIFPLLCAVVALRSGWEKYKFWTFFFLFGIITALRYSPLFMLFHELPGFEYFRGANRWMYIGNLGLTVLAAYGFDHMMVQGFKIPERAFMLLRRFALALAGVALMTTLTYAVLRTPMISIANKYFDNHYYSSTLQLPREHYHRVIESLADRTIDNINLRNHAVIVPILSLFGSLLLIRRTSHQYWAPIAIVLSAANLILLHPNYWQIIPGSLVNKEPEAVSIIRSDNADLKQYRMLSVFPGTTLDLLLRSRYPTEYTQSDVIEFQESMIQANTNMQWDIDSIDGYNNLMSRKNAEVAALLGGEYTPAGDRIALKSMPIEGKVALLLKREPLLSLAGVRYLVSAVRFPDSAPFELLGTTSATRFNIPVFIYKNDRALPKVYFADRIQFTKDSSTVLSSEASNLSFIECLDCASGQPSIGDSLTEVDYNDGYVEFISSTVSDRWVIFSESFLPGWKASIDERQVEVFRANHIFQAVKVPKGIHRVRFEFNRV